MIEGLARIILVSAALYLAALGACALLAPARARAFLSGFVGSARLHFLELGLRLLVGAALLVHAPRSEGEATLTVTAWLLVGTTLVIALVPWRLHQAFARRSVPQALRVLPLLGVASLALGAGLLAAAFHG